VRAGVGVPLIREGNVVGVLTVVRREPRAFTQKQIELAETFADQAVIAIENARLFDEVQARTRELSEALEQQTATNEILGVIAASPTNIQPVLQAVAESACRLCEAYDSVIRLCEGEWLRVRAHHGPIPVDVVGSRIGRGWVTGPPSLIGNRSTCTTSGPPPTSSPMAARTRAASDTGPFSPFPC
jgi:hypothetical protein